jgi:hypothetical protein
MHQRKKKIKLTQMIFIFINSCLIWRFQMGHGTNLKRNNLNKNECRVPSW